MIDIANTAFGFLVLLSYAGYCGKYSNLLGVTTLKVSESFVREGIKIISAFFLIFLQADHKKDRILEKMNCYYTRAPMGHLKSQFQMLRNNVIMM